MGIRSLRSLVPLAGLVLCLGAGSAQAQRAFEAYYRYVGEYPTSETGFHNDSQGVTTDGTWWYWTQAKVENDPNHPENALWKIPVTMDLGSVSPGGSVSRRIVGETPLGDTGLWHMGDLSYYEHEGVGYLVMGVEGGAGCSNVLAVFRAADLSYVDHEPVCDWVEHAPWCAVDGEGNLYTSDYDSPDAGGDVTIEKFSVDWNLVATQGDLQITHVASIALEDETGAPLALERVQGGVVSPSAEMMYLAVFGDYYYDPVFMQCVIRGGGGINVFHMEGESTWRRVRISTNGSGPFNYQYDPCELLPEEPEGLTIWDFDDQSAPGISGQLHVIMLDNDPLDDDIYFKHYTNKIFVPGTQTTVADAVSYGWDGAILRLDPGSYPQSFTASKRLLMEARSTSVVIGSP